MNEWIDSRTRAWAVGAVVAEITLFLGLELIDEPDATLLDLLLELVEIIPVVLTSVGVALLFRVTKRQREEHLQVIHDLEIARVQGQRWRSEARSLLNGLGQAIDAQLSRWNLTEAEREVALLLLKGLSTKELPRSAPPADRSGAGPLDLLQGWTDRPCGPVGVLPEGLARNRRAKRSRVGGVDGTPDYASRLLLDQGASGSSSNGHLSAQRSSWPVFLDSGLYPSPLIPGGAALLRRRRRPPGAAHRARGKRFPRR
jgi:hypothetical protein